MHCSLRLAARERAAQRQAEALQIKRNPVMQHGDGAHLEAPQEQTQGANPTTPESTAATPHCPNGSAANAGTSVAPNVVVVMGMDPPLGSQDPLMTPPRSPPSPCYTWERTIPVNGRASGLFVLHLGLTPQSSPMSRTSPNRIVNRRELKEALHVVPSQGRRGQSDVRRQAEDAVEEPAPNKRSKQRLARPARGGGDKTRQKASSVAPPGWETPVILLGQRSPIFLRSQTKVQGFTIAGEDGRTAQHDEEEQHMGISASIQTEIFTPGAVPPMDLVPSPVHSPSEHRFLSEQSFPEALRVRVRCEILDLDPGLVGDKHGLTGVVKARFFHHVTGSPMFTIDFGGAIGMRSVLVSDSQLDAEVTFSDTQRTLFPVFKTTTADVLDGTSQGGVQSDSENDPDWHGEFADFEWEEATGETSSDDVAPSYTEDPLKELGMYDGEEDVSSWPFEKVFADEQWQDQSITLLQDTKNFSGPEPGPTSAVADHPSNYFLRYWTPELLQRVVNETNRYAEQPCHLNNAVTNGRADWTPLDSEELLAWFGILILMGLKEFPHIRCYWDRKPFYNCPLISEAMPRKRFEAIVRCLHFVDNRDFVQDPQDAAYDKLAKVRWLCESFASMSQQLYNNERVLTVDEIIIPYKGRFCNIRQYMKSKPVKFGVKVWALANSESRYVSNILVYLGADELRREGDFVGEDAVLSAIAGLEQRGHVIITDNFFTSPRLFMELLRRGFWATGTCRKTKKGFPPSLVGFPNNELPERGHLVVKMHRSRQIAAICWMDAKPVFLLSTSCDPIGEDTFAGHWIGRECVDFPTSPILLEYQAGMRGVDLVD